MQGNVGLILLSKKILNAPERRWDGVEDTLHRYLELYDNFNVFLCGNGSLEDPPDKVSKLVHEYHKFPRYDIQKLATMGLKSALNAACKYSIVVNGPIVSDDLSFMDEKKLLVRIVVDRTFDLTDKKIQSDFMFGKTKSLLRIWENRPFCRTMPDEINLYKNFKNLLGEKGIWDEDKLSVKTAEQLKLKRMGW